MPQKKFLLLTFALLLTATAAFAFRNFIICGTDFMPFGPGPEKVLREAYAALGYNLVVHRMPIPRSLEESNMGRFEGELARVGGIESRYKNLVRVDVPIFDLEVVAVTKDKSRRIREWSDLGGLTVAYPRGAIIMEQNLPENVGHLAPFLSLEKGMALLLAGRADVLLSSRKNLAGDDLEGLYVQEPPLEHVHVYHYLHKKNRALVPKLEAVLRKMREQGRIARILNKD